MLITAERSCLLLVDIQERLAPAVPDAGAVVANCGTLLKAAARLEIPVLASEEYRAGLGVTVSPLIEALDESQRHEKMHFSCASEPGIAAALAALGRDQVVIAGLETHVCVLQSALGLKAAGYQPFVVADATASRAQTNYALAINRLRRGDVGIVSVEMVLFEWLAVAGTPEFKDVLELIK